MKKKFFTLGLAMCGAMAASAQLPVQNFNNGIPATWTMVKVDNNIPSSTAWVTPIVTGLTANAWMTWPRATGDSCVLTTSLFAPAGTADRWLITPSFSVTSNNMIMTWEDYAYDVDALDNMQVLVSTTAGTTPASFTATIYDQPGGIDDFVKRGISLAAYNGQTIRVAFRNHSTNKSILQLDNIGTEVLTTALDGSVTAVNFPTLATGSAQVKVTVKNAGAQTITALKLTYKIDNGTAITQTFNSLSLSAYGSQELTFTTPVSGLSSASHNLQVDLVETNGAADPVATNNGQSKVFSVPGNAVARAGLIEEFTSSTCVPCAGFNAVFDPLIVGATVNANVPGSNFNIIKYQMNWPTPGNDKSYNATGSARRAYYGVDAIPDHFTNGMQGGNGDQQEIDDSKTAPAYLSISGTYTIKSDSVFASVTVTPNFTITGANFKLHMATTEKHYTNNAATTTQKEYYHVMRNMIPSAAGTTVANWTSGVPQTFNFAQKYIVGTPAQSNNNFWASPYGSNLVVFVQDDNSHEVLQSAVIPAKWPTSVSTIASIKQVSLFPNPAKDAARLMFNVAENAQVNIQVIDAVGRTVQVLVDEKMSVGDHQIDINTNTMAAGNYNVVIRTANGSTTERLTVAK